MRHAMAGNRLNRNSSLRKATVRDLAKATLVEQRICTTKAKAKEARKLVEKLITLGKRGTLADRRRAFAILCDHQLVSDLFNKTSPRFKSRLGGYTRIISLGTRRGDNAQLAFLELTEKEEIVISKPKSAKAAAKTETVDVTPVKPVRPAGGPKVEKVETKETLKEIAPKKDFKHDPKNAVIKEKAKGPKFGGLRKMFQRKTGGE